MRADMGGMRGDIAGLRTEITGLRADLNLQADRTERGFNDLGNFMRQIARDQTTHEGWHTNHVEKLERDVEDPKARVRSLEERAGETP